MKALVKYQSGAAPCYILLDSAPSGFVSDMSFLMSTDAGQNWTTTQTKSFEFTVLKYS